MKDKEHTSSQTDDNFERYVAFRTSRGANIEFWTGIASLSLFITWPWAILAYLFWRETSFAIVSYVFAGGTALIVVVHLGIYFARRHAWW